MYAIRSYYDTIGIKEFNISNNTFILTYTCGVASNSDNLLTYADIALAEAKNKRVKILAYDHRITSYNVCYTKLLRDLKQRTK